MAVAIRTKDGETVKTGTDEWKDSVPDVQAVNLIKVKAGSNTLKSFQGDQFNPSSVTVTLNRGWNWLGYPLDQALVLTDAFVYLNVEEGDYIFGLDQGFAEFVNGNWSGDLKVLKPGHGYMYKSVSQKSFVYGNVQTLNPAAVEVDIMPANIPYSVNAHAYPDMMAVTALVMDGDEQASESRFVIAAFAGDECRGIGKHVDGTVRISVYGDKADELTFKAIEIETGKEFAITEKAAFTPDVIGSQASPVVLNFDIPSGVESVAGSREVKSAFNLKGQMVDPESAGGGIFIIDGSLILK